MAISSSLDSLTISWLVRVRWVAVVAQSLLILAIAAFTGLEVPVAALHGILAFAAFSNFGLMWWAKQDKSDAIIPIILGMDIVLLTAGLQLSGGPMNPFSFLYVVHVALAAFVVRGVATWVLLAMAIGGYGLLYGIAANDPHLHHHHSAEAMQLHLDGMWVAMAAAAGFIVIFLSRLRKTMDLQAEELSAMRQHEEQQSKLATMATLAAGAAHELATPLASIAIAAKELELILEDREDDLVEEAAVIRSQTQRCRGILQSLSAQSGRIPGEQTLAVEVADLLEKAVSKVTRPDLVFVGELSGSASLHLPASAVTESLSAIMQNSIDAGASRIEVVAGPIGKQCSITISDDGPGVPEEVLARVFEPFFTTKGVDQNRMGLGLFVAHQLAVELGGDLHMDSSPEGTTTRWLLRCQGLKDELELR